MSIISTENLNKTYHESEVPVHALKDVNLNIEQGEFTAVVGPSGSGKSTLLHLIGGLDIPSAGKVIIDGIDINTFSGSKLTEYRLYNIGFVFQAYNLLPVLSAVENVEFIMLLQKKAKQQRRKRALELIDAVGLAGRAGHKPVQLSGGEQQRVAVARAIASNPKYVLADEPTANLDSHSAGILLDIMESLNNNLETTFIFSTHDERVVRRARRVIELEDGKVKGI
ncbi:MAG TPA: ABC transporter ATP-binding protein [Chitinispirillaceae bacterium]|nr:ABC transporter ATP-binding protein [Chitinispirillaceae bacterium]